MLYRLSGSLRSESAQAVRGLGEEKAVAARREAMRACPSSCKAATAARGTAQGPGKKASAVAGRTVQGDDRGRLWTVREAVKRKRTGGSPDGGSSRSNRPTATTRRHRAHGWGRKPSKRCDVPASRSETHPAHAPRFCRENVARLAAATLLGESAYWREDPPAVRVYWERVHNDIV